jgi:GNAT superfamily N-acetyltransferase
MSQRPTIEQIADAQVDGALDSQLRDLLVTCFPKDPQFRGQRHWRELPLHRWFIRGDDDQRRLAAHVCIHRKVLGTETGGDLLVGGVAAVCVRPEFRGRGFARLMLAQVQPWLAQRGYEFGMLFGNRRVYSSSGYIVIDNPLRYIDWESRQPKIEVLSNAMVRQLAAKPWPTGVIDLRGPTF